jgi:membrane protease YdiL (CAAX protease family)
VNALLAPHRRIIWVAWLIAALLFLAIGNSLVYGVTVPLTAGLLVLLAPGLAPSAGRHMDGRDIRAVLLLYIGVVAALYFAFQVFTVGRTLGLFLCYAAGLILGVVGPVIYTVWMRRRPLADLGLTTKNWREAVGLGLLLGAIQYFLTLSGYRLPVPIDWVPLLTMSLMVGLFEAIFFRGFIQTRLSASFGPIPGVVGAAALYALYHVGYGMGAREMMFLFALGLVYGIAYACVKNVLVLWPVLIPIGSFYNNLRSGGIDLPWAAIAGFVDVMAIMFAVIWLARRRERRAASQPQKESPIPPRGLETSSGDPQPRCPVARASQPATCSTSSDAARKPT